MMNYRRAIARQDARRAARKQLEEDISESNLLIEYYQMPPPSYNGYFVLTGIFIAVGGVFAALYYYAYGQYL